jgi:hypothetical protein
MITHTNYSVYIMNFPYILGLLDWWPLPYHMLGQVSLNVKKKDVEAMLIFLNK